MLVQLYGIDFHVTTDDYRDRCTKEVPEDVRELYQHDQAPSLDALLEKVKVMSKEPLKDTVYSGGGFIIVEKILELLVGKPFYQIAKEEVFDPLEMNHSTFEQTSEKDIIMGETTLVRQMGYSPKEHSQLFQYSNVDNIRRFSQTCKRDR